MDIMLCRANANRQIARILDRIIDKHDVKLIDLEGGTLRNAIPREAFATVYVPAGKTAAVLKTVSAIAAEIKSEYAATDPGLQVIFEPYKCEEGACCDPDECRYVQPQAAKRFIKAILACPDAVERMSDAMPGMVETSNNPAMVKI